MMNTLNREALDPILESKLHSLMEGMGFKEEEGTMYLRKKMYYDIFPNTSLKIYFGYFYKIETLSKRIFIVEDLWQDLKKEVFIHDGKNFPTIHISFYDKEAEILDEPFYDTGIKGIKCLATQEGAEKYIQICEPLIRNYLLVCSEKYNDLREINRIAMSSFLMDEGSFPIQGFLGTNGANFRRLIIAKMAGEPRYEELYDFEMSFEKDYIEAAKANPSMPYLAQYPNVFREIYNRLKKVEPLENPVLS